MCVFVARFNDDVPRDQCSHTYNENVYFADAELHTLSRTLSCSNHKDEAQALQDLCTLEDVQEHRRLKQNSQNTAPRSVSLAILTAVTPRSKAFLLDNRHIFHEIYRCFHLVVCLVVWRYSGLKWMSAYTLRTTAATKLTFS
jgi:hypothetical protein